MAYYKIRPRSGTGDQWRTANPVLLEREVGYEVPSDRIGSGAIKMKMGDGITPWNDLPYAIDPESVENTPVIGDEWVNNKSYDVGDYCIYKNKLWKCLVQNIDVAPSEGTYWHNTNITSITKELNSSLVKVDIATGTTNSGGGFNISLDPNYYMITNAIALNTDTNIIVRILPSDGLYWFVPLHVTESKNYPYTEFTVMYSYVKYR